MEALDRYLKLINGRTLYNSGRMLHASNGNWFIEAHDPATTVTEHDGMFDITTPKGFTMWYDSPLEGNYRITYRAMLPKKGGACDRASDLNCFWGASDPDYPDDLYANAAWRKGIFQHYKTLKLFYVGYGGNYNTTTRFRKYYGGGPAVHDSMRDGRSIFSVNGKKLFEYALAPGEADGYFGLRLLSNHCFIKDFKVEKL